MAEKYCIKQIGFVPPPYGGVSVYLARLIERLNEDGFRTGGYYISKSDTLSLADSTLFDKWKWLRIRDIIWRIPGFLNEIKAYKIVHSHFSLEGMIYLWFAKIVGRKKIVITVHNSMVGTYFKQTSAINKIFLRWMTNSNVSWIAVSQQAKEELLRLPLHFKEEIKVIPAYLPIKVDTKYVLPDSLDDYFRKYRQILVFYGHSFMSNAGNDVYGFYDVLTMYAAVIERCQNSIGLIYCIADQFDELNFSKVRAKAEELGLASLIYWQVGPLPTMLPLWERADVYVRPTSTDGDSVAVREALDMGVQVVASDVCLRPNQVIVYKHGDNESFISAVVKALKIGRAGINRDDTHYQQMLHVYQQLL